MKADAGLRDVPGLRIAQRYVVMRSLGRGGTGEVFLVHDTHSGREVALKRLWHEHLSKPRITARFAREVQITRKMDHPAIVKVRDAAHDGEDLFFTMDVVDGVNLRTWMYMHGRSSVEAAVRVAGMAARALDHGHRHTIHRDVSPENIMVSPSGAITLIDFGLAKRHGCTEGLTIVNTPLGRREYSAPEQERNASSVNLGADLYPLGVVFYEMLTQQRTRVAQAMEAARPDVGKHFDAFLSRALAEDAGERYPSARELHDDLLGAYCRYQDSKHGIQARRGLKQACGAPRRWWFRILEGVREWAGAYGSKAQ
ncbi:MAG: serine/threonine protein kinase [Candidatus Hydrogenedentes bacterium]|nr:serine/threonine protein kinase [Candidatus Hydrogenedentota bacterium]